MGSSKILNPSPNNLLFGGSKNRGTPTPPPNLLSGSQYDASKGGGNYSLNGGVPLDESNFGQSYSPFAGYSNNFNDTAKSFNNVQLSNGQSGGGNSALGNAFKASYNPFFLRF